MTDSSLDLSARADLDWLTELIGDAKQAAPSVEWLVVGALARDLHLGYAHGIRVDRVTTDTDLALTVATWTEFAQIQHALIASGKFVAVGRSEHKFFITADKRWMSCHSVISKIAIERSRGHRQAK